MKKILALILTAVMMLSLCVTAFADDTTPTYSITVTNNNSSISINGNTYYAYKLFDVKYEGDAYAYTISTSNHFYGNSVLDDYFTFTKSAGDATIYNVTVKDGVTFDEAAAREMADKLQAYLPNTADSSAEAANEEAVIGLDDAGYYLVAGEVDAIHEGQDDTNPKVNSALAVTTTDPKRVIEVKADAPDIDKWIVNGDQVLKTVDSSTKLGKATAVNVGDTVTFRHYSKVPTTTGYDLYKFIVHDVYTSGLTLDLNSFDVKIGENTLDKGTDYSLDTTTAGKFTLTIEDLLVTETVGEDEDAVETRKYADGADIIITYNAVLNENAVKTDVETNTVKLEYSSNPYNTSETKKTPEHVVYVYDFDIDVDKFTETSAEGETTINKKLAGAKFVLHNEAGEYYVWNATNKEVDWYTLAEGETVKAAVAAGNITELETPVTGKVTFEGLDSGKYFLTETEAPTGYNLLTGDVEVNITVSYNDDGTVDETNTTKRTDTDNDQYYITESVKNETGKILPATGGMGTTIFYIIGSVLVIGAAILLITKKRMSTKG